MIEIQFLHTLHTHQSRPMAGGLPPWFVPPVMLDRLAPDAADQRDG